MIGYPWGIPSKSFKNKTGEDATYYPPDITSF